MLVSAPHPVAASDDEFASNACLSYFIDQARQVKPHALHHHLPPHILSRLLRLDFFNVV